MKQFFVIAVMALFLSGCGAFVAAPVSGFIYSDVQAPFMATSNTVSTKVGTAEMSSILGLVAQGDASIQKAAQSAGITQISHIDYEAKSILGIYATFTIYVYGN